MVLERGVFGAGMPILDILVATKICETKSEARRLIEQGGITIDDAKISDVKFVLPSDRFEDGSGALIRKGKKHYFKLVLR